MERTAEPMDKIDPLEPMLSSEAEPPGRGAPSVVFMGAFSQPADQRHKRAACAHSTQPGATHIADSGRSG